MLQVEANTPFPLSNDQISKDNTINEIYDPFQSAFQRENNILQDNDFSMPYNQEFIQSKYQNEEYQAPNLNVQHDQIQNNAMNQNFNSQVDNNFINPQKYHPDLEGCIVIQSISANLKRDTAWIGQMHCYCRIIADDQVCETSISSRQGTKPEWNEKNSLHIKEKAEIRIQIFNKNKIQKDELVCETMLNCNNLFAHGNFFHENLKSQLYFKSRMAGHITLSIELLTKNDILQSYQKGSRYEDSNGMIHLSNIQGNLYSEYNKYVFGIDSYLEFSFKGEELNTARTPVNKKGNLEPKWEQENICIRRTKHMILDIKLQEKTLTNSQLIGFSQVYLKDVLQKGRVECLKFRIKNEQEIFVGEFQMTIEWIPDLEQREGTIIAIPVQAKLQRDTELIGQMDPYVKITIGNISQSSYVIDEGGKTPQWIDTDELIFERKDEYEAKIQVYDEDVTKDDLVGEGKILLQQIFSQNYSENDITLYYNNEEVGIVTIKWLWIPNFDNRPGYILIRSNQNQKIMIPEFGNQIQQQVIVRRFDNNIQQITIFDNKKRKIGSSIIPLCRIMEQSDILKKWKNYLKMWEIDISWHPDSYLHRGILAVSPIQAQLERDTDIIGKMDPYVVLRMGSLNAKTSVHKNGGKMPNWTETFQFYRNNEYILHINVMDQDLTYDDLVGEAKFNLQDLFENQHGIVDTWVELLYKNKIIGKIRLELTWKPENIMDIDAEGNLFQYNQNPQLQQDWKQTVEENNILLSKYLQGGTRNSWKKAQIFSEDKPYQNQIEGMYISQRGSDRSFYTNQYVSTYHYNTFLQPDPEIQLHQQYMEDKEKQFLQQVDSVPGQQNYDFSLVL